MRIVIEGIKIGMMMFCIGVLTFILANAAMLEQDYMEKYETAYDNLVIEHERQMVVGEMIQSQQAWERTADALRVALAEERADANTLRLQYDVDKYELYVFMRILERDYPGLAAAVNFEINNKRQELQDLETN